MTNQIRRESTLDRHFHRGDNQPTMRVLDLAAAAKINLHLEVLGRRPDGFHALETVFQTLALHDRVQVAVAGEGVALECSDPALAGPGNLAWRAAAVWLARRPDLGGVRVRLDKRLPHGAGLGGGSSDAATVLRALARLDPAPPPPAEIAAMALELGSDVPFFLLGGTAGATGRGEELTALPDLPACAVTVLMPAATLPTPTVFKALGEAERGPRAARGAAWAAASAPAALLHNRLSAAACRLCPEVAALLAWLAGRGVPHLMSGSGAACFALAELDPPPGVRAWRTRFRARGDLDALSDS
jgi:4-diphosphocytidyl-2-C-methyl-D-erythritol kinase